jgi:CheY-like chemotaxis protein
MLKRLRVLVVEDDAAYREPACAALAGAGFDVLEATSGLGAGEMIRTGPRLDALFTDIHLGPGPDGWDVARAFRLRYPDAPILYATGYIAGANRSLRRSLLFPKPYRLSKLVALIAVLLAPDRDASQAGEAGALTRLTYMSRATSLMQHPTPALACEELGEQARRLNRIHGITGALLASPDWFVQTLEGEQNVVLATLARINRDPRNIDLRVFEIEGGSERLFGDWSMHVGAFEALSPSLVARCLEAFARPGAAEVGVLHAALRESVDKAA